MYILFQTKKDLQFSKTNKSLPIQYPDRDKNIAIKQKTEMINMGMFLSKLHLT